jgi:hypothetical protein
MYDDGRLPVFTWTGGGTLVLRGRRCRNQAGPVEDISRTPLDAADISDHGRRLCTWFSRARGSCEDGPELEHGCDAKLDRLHYSTRFPSDVRYYDPGPSARELGLGDLGLLVSVLLLYVSGAWMSIRSGTVLLSFDE